MPVPFSATTRSLAADTPFHSALGWLAAGVLGALWLAWFLFGSVTVYETSAQARLEVLRAAHPLAARAAGSVLAVNFALGRQVAAGQVLVQLDDRAERLTLAEENTRKQALPLQIQALARQIAAQEETLAHGGRGNQAAVAAARAKWREAQSSAKVAAEHARRIDTLHGKGLIGEYEWLKIRGEAQQAQSSVEEQAEEIRRLESETLGGASRERAKLEESKKNLADLEGQLRHSEAAAARLESEIETHRIIAPIAGRIGEISPDVRTGGYLAEGQAVAKIVPLGGLKIVARFLPKDALGRVHPGQTGRLRLDAFPWIQYGSLDVAVTQAGEEIRDGYQQVELAVTSAHPRMPLQHGLTGTVEVAVETTSPAYLVLRAAGRMLARPAPDDAGGETR
jgi:membrane fusion protein (multidrug efflux system)